MPSRRPLRRISRDIVEGARPILAAIWRILRPAPAQVSDLDTFVLRQISGIDRAYRQAIQRGNEPDYLAVPVTLVSACPVVC